MAYDKNVWACGDEITAEKLNHMEDGIADGGGDAGYECVETVNWFVDTTINTESSEPLPFISGSIPYSEQINMESITVVFEGETYKLDAQSNPNGTVYGELDSNMTPVFTTYPFAVLSMYGQNLLATPQTGSYTVKIGLPSETVSTTECFKKAVQMNSCFFVRIKFNGNTFDSMDKTFDEITNAVESKIPCFMAIEHVQSGAPTIFLTAPIRGDGYGTYYGSYVFIGDGADGIRDTLVKIPSTGTPTIISNNIPLS